MNRLDSVEQTIIDVVAKFGPWLSPVPTAFLIGRAAVIHLEWPLIVAIAASMVVEVMGLTVASTGLELHQYNQSKRKSDPKAPFWIAAVLMALYFVVAVGLTALLDIAPALAKYAPAIFPGLSMTGVLTLALRLDHRRRVLAIKDEMAERKAERAQTRAKNPPRAAQNEDAQNAQDSSPSLHNGPHNGAQSRKERTKSALVEAYRSNPHLGISDAARLVGIHRNSVYNHLNELEVEGKVHRNGNGIEVLG